MDMAGDPPHLAGPPLQCWRFILLCSVYPRASSVQADDVGIRWVPNPQELTTHGEDRLLTRVTVHGTSPVRATR